MTNGSANQLSSSETVGMDAASTPQGFPPGLDAASFKLAFRHHAAGVAVILPSPAV